MSGRMIGTVEGAVGHIVFDNPERRNAISDTMAAEAVRLCAEMDADPAVRVVVVSGSGEKSFVAGRDINSVRQEGKEGLPPREADDPTVAIYAAFHDISKPTVARIRGFCIGGGLALASCCDIRIAAGDAQFAIPAARLGIGYRPDMTRWLVEAVGPAFAKEILITARRFNAEEAKAIGLVHHVVPVEELVSFTDSYVAAIADNAPLSMKASKAIINEVSHGLHKADLALCDALVADCMKSEDLAEGRKAFLEKRRPQFHGR